MPGTSLVPYAGSGALVPVAGPTALAPSPSLSPLEKIKNELTRWVLQTRTVYRPGRPGGAIGPLRQGLGKVASRGVLGPLGVAATVAEAMGNNNPMGDAEIRRQMGSETPFYVPGAKGDLGRGDRPSLLANMKSAIADGTTDSPAGVLDSFRKASGISQSNDAPPPISAAVLDALVANAAGATNKMIPRMGARKPDYKRDAGAPTRYPGGQPNEYDTPPTGAGSYRNIIANLMNESTIGNGVRATPVLPVGDDPRKSPTGTLEFSRAGAEAGRSIFDTKSGRDYLTAMQLRRDAEARGDKSYMPPLPGLRGVGLGTPAGQPVPGGKTDQYNQMKAAQRANQLANEANAPNLIMAREQLRNMGPQGAIMMNLLGQRSGGGGPDMSNPVMLAAVNPAMAGAALQQQDTQAQMSLAQSRDMMGLIGDYLAGGGDPQGAREVIRNIRGGGPQDGMSRPGQDVPRAPGVDAETHDAAHRGDLTPQISQQIDEVFGTVDLSPGMPDSIGSWDAQAVAEAKALAAEKLKKTYGLSDDQARALVEEYHRRKYSGSLYGVPRPGAARTPAPSQQESMPFVPMS